MVNNQRPDDKIESHEPDIEGHLHREDLGGLLMGGKPTRPVPKLIEDDEDVSGHVNPRGVDD